MYLPAPRSTRRGRALATIIIIVANVIVYIITSWDNALVETSSEWVEKLAYIPVLLRYPTQWYRLLSSMFTHADIFHIFFNMYFLYIFGREVERAIGSGRYLLLYLVSGLLASVFHTAFTPIAGSIGLIIPAVGASGAISGVLGAYMLLYPRRVLSLCIFIPLPLCFTTQAIYFLLFWFATQVIYGYMRFSSGIAYFAHAGGFVAGIALLYLLKPRSEKLVPTMFPEYYSSPLISYRRLGLGRGSKILAGILVFSLFVGAVYCMFTAPNLRGVYVMDIIARRSGAQPVQDQAVYTLSGEVVPPITDDARVVFNRFYWAGLLTGEPGYSNNNFEYSGYVLAKEYNKRLKLEIRGRIEYDENGVLKLFEGRVVTDVLLIRYVWIYAVVDVRQNVVYTASISTEEVAGNIGLVILEPFAAISTLVSAIALGVVVTKDKELSEELVYEEESSWSYGYGPHMFT